MPRPNDVGVGVCVLIENDKGEILLMKRKGAHSAGCWALPGGWIDRTDTRIEEAIGRELGEEVNLTMVGLPTLLEATTEDHEDLNCRTVTLYYQVTNFLGVPKIMEPEKCSEIGWFSHRRLPSPLFPGLRGVLDRTNQISW